MTRATICHTLSALAAVAFVPVFAGGPVAAQGRWDHNAGPRGNLFVPNPAGSAATQSNGLAAKKQSQRSRPISDPGVQKELSLSDDQSP